MPDFFDQPLLLAPSLCTGRVPSPPPRPPSTCPTATARYPSLQRHPLLTSSRAQPADLGGAAVLLPAKLLCCWPLCYWPEAAVLLAGTRRVVCMRARGARHDRRGVLFAHLTWRECRGTCLSCLPDAGRPLPLSTPVAPPSPGGPLAYFRDEIPSP